MLPWLADKLDSLTEEFLAGEGCGNVYEAFYLAYLEVLLVARNDEPGKVWTLHKERIDTLRGDDPAVPLNRLVEGRGALVTELTNLRKKLTGSPTPKRFAAPKPKPVGATDLSDIFGFSEQ